MLRVVKRQVDRRLCNFSYFNIETGANIILIKTNLLELLVSNVLSEEFINGKYLKKNTILISFFAVFLFNKFI